MESKNCQECGAVLNLIPAGVSKRTNKSYPAFLACPNKCKSKWNDKKPPADEDTLKIISDALGNINDRLDKMGQYLKDKLESKNPFPS